MDLIQQLRNLADTEENDLPLRAVEEIERLQRELAAESKRLDHLLTQLGPDKRWVYIGTKSYDLKECRENIDTNMGVEPATSLSNDSTGATPCCGEYATCGRPCTPRGKWLVERTRDSYAEAATAYAEGLRAAAQRVVGTIGYTVGQAGLADTVRIFNSPGAHAEAARAVRALTAALENAPSGRAFGEACQMVNGVMECNVNAIAPEVREAAKERLDEILRTAPDRALRTLSDFVHATGAERARVGMKVIDRAIEAQRAAVGWKLVPIEPTEAMLDAVDEPAAVISDWWGRMLGAVDGPVKPDRERA